MSEQNRSTLEQAIQRLPQHDAPAGSWERLQQQLDQEAAEAPLQSALQQLKGYDAPAPVWQEIEKGLEQPNTLQPALSALPEYSPPASVWEGIESQLPQAKAGRLRPLTLWAGRAAAAIALALAAWWAWPADISTMKESYAYQTEAASSDWQATADWQEDERAMQLALNAFKQDPIARSLEEYPSLLREWKELSDARKEINSIMERYGKDARLVRQLSEIERERSRLLRNMIAQI